MRDHPLTPMTDANLVRVLGRQTTATVDLVPLSIVRDGATAIAKSFERLTAAGVTYAVVDATEDRHLLAIGKACTDLPLLTGGSGVALGLPANFRRRGLLGSATECDTMPRSAAATAVLPAVARPPRSRQIETFAKTYPALKLDPEAIAEGKASVAEAIAWATPKLAAGPLLIYSSAPPADIAAIQAKLGRERAGALVEDALAAYRRRLGGRGVRRLVVAGGETSGAVVQRAGRHDAAHRPPDRSRRALDLQPRPSRAWPSR